MEEDGDSEQSKFSKMIAFPIGRVGCSLTSRSAFMQKIDFIPEDERRDDPLFERITMALSSAEAAGDKISYEVAHLRNRMREYLKIRGLPVVLTEAEHRQLENVRNHSSGPRLARILDEIDDVLNFSLSPQPKEETVGSELAVAA